MTKQPHNVEFILVNLVAQDEAGSGACTALVPVTRPVMVTSGK